MKTGVSILVSVVAGFAVGAGAVQALHAQAKPPAFVVGEIDIRNVDLLDKEYVQTGKIGGIGLSEVKAATIHEAAKITKIAAVEVELSL